MSKENPDANIQDALTRQKKEDLRLISDAAGTKYAYRLKAHAYVAFKKSRKLRSFLEKVKKNKKNAKSKRFDINVQLEPDGETLLHWCVRWNRHKMIPFLLEHGIDRSVKNDAGWTALDYAKKLHNVHISGRLKCTDALRVESTYEFRIRWHRNLRSVLFPLFNCHFTLVAFVNVDDIATYLATGASEAAYSIVCAAAITHPLLLFRYDEQPSFYKHVYVCYGLYSLVHKHVLRLAPFLVGFGSLAILFVLGAMAELLGSRFWFRRKRTKTS